MKWNSCQDSTSQGSSCNKPLSRLPVSPCCPPPPHCLGIHLVRVVWKPWNHHSAKFSVGHLNRAVLCSFKVSLLQCKTDHLEAINLAIPHFFHLKIACLTWDTVKTTHNILFCMSARCWQKCNKCEWILSSLLYFHQFNLTSIYSMFQDPASTGRDAVIKWSSLLSGIHSRRADETNTWITVA